VNSSLFVAAARPTLSVDRQLDHSFKTPKVPCDCLKVGLDFVSTDFQAVAWHFGPASRSRSRDKHTTGPLLHTMHSPLCHNVLSSCHAHSPPLLPFAAEGTWKPASITASTWRREMAQCRQALDVVWLYRLLRSRRNICEFEWSFRSR